MKNISNKEQGILDLLDKGYAYTDIQVLLRVSPSSISIAKKRRQLQTEKSNGVEGEELPICA